jgi:hypothetical protein
MSIVENFNASQKIKELMTYNLDVHDIIYIVKIVTHFTFSNYDVQNKTLVFRDPNNNILKINMEESHTIFSIFNICKDVIHDLGKSKGKQEAVDSIANFFKTL